MRHFQIRRAATEAGALAAANAGDNDFATRFFRDVEAADLYGYARDRGFPPPETLARKLAEMESIPFTYTSIGDMPEAERAAFIAFRATAEALNPLHQDDVPGEAMQAPSAAPPPIGELEALLAATGCKDAEVVGDLVDIVKQATANALDHRDQAQMVIDDRKLVVAERDELRNRITALEADGKLLEENIKTISGERDELRNRITALEADGKLLEENIKTISGERDEQRRRAVEAENTLKEIRRNAGPATDDGAGADAPAATSEAGTVDQAAASGGDEPVVDPGKPAAAQAADQSPQPVAGKPATKKKNK